MSSLRDLSRQRALAGYDYNLLQKRQEYRQKTARNFSKAGKPNVNVGDENYQSAFPASYGTYQDVNFADVSYPSSLSLSSEPNMGMYLNGGAGGGNLSIVEERFVQFTGILGFAGPTVGFSIAKLPSGEAAVYWNKGYTTGFDLPNVDMGITIHMSLKPNINWVDKLEGYSTTYGGSISFFGATLGGNQDEFNFWSCMNDYGSFSIMVNIGPNDYSIGINKNRIEQKYLFTIPKWLGAPW